GKSHQKKSRHLADSDRRVQRFERLGMARRGASRRHGRLSAEADSDQRDQVDRREIYPARELTVTRATSASPRCAPPASDESSGTPSTTGAASGWRGFLPSG